jgi:predicted dehydrogenase
MAEGRVNLAAITTRRVPFASALTVYRDLLGEAARDIGVVLEYDASGAPPPAAELKPQAAAPGPPPRRVTKPVTSVDVIGAGNFARTMLLPHLRGQIGLGTVVNQTALSAGHVKEKFGFAAAATDAGAVLGDKAGQGVLIATRHHLHAPLVLDALRANRHVFVEKPLCLKREELGQIDEAMERTEGSVQVGFNRRFAPASAELARVLAGSPGPKSATYRVAAGKLDPAHWYANYAESGGRVLGEACHFLDYFCFMFAANPVRVFAQTTWPAAGRLPFPDSVAAQIEFADGSSGQLIYTAEGDPGFPKETLTVFGSGVVAEVTNFQELAVHRARKAQRFSYSSKGHAEQMTAWIEFLRGNREHPLPYKQARTSMLLTFAVLESIQQGRAVEVA